MSKQAKKITKFDALLQSHIDKKHFVKITRTFKKQEDIIYGFILDMSQHFLLLQIEIDFIFDGYAIIRKDQFDSLRHDITDKFHKKILKVEGILEREYGFSYKINMRNWQKIFTDLKKCGYHVIVECEDLNEPEFIIGPIKKIHSKKLKIQYYNSLGLLEEDFTSILYKDITIVKFDDRYSKTYKKYLTESKSSVLKTEKT